MIDIYLYNDVRNDVSKKCKKLYKKGFFDTSWKRKVDEIMKKDFSSIMDFLKDKT